MTLSPLLPTTIFILFGRDSIVLSMTSWGIASIISITRFAYSLYVSLWIRNSLACSRRERRTLWKTFSMGFRSGGLGGMLNVDPPTLRTAFSALLDLWTGSPYCKISFVAECNTSSTITLISTDMIHWYYSPCPLIYGWRSPHYIYIFFFYRFVNSDDYRTCSRTVRP